MLIFHSQRQSAGPYLNQTPPGATAEIFAPGIVNTGLWTRDIAISPDGAEIYFGVGVGNYDHASIMVTRKDGTQWTKPEKAGFSRDDRWSYSEPAISPDGNQMFFVSNRPEANSADPVPHAIWVMDRNRGAWGEPRRLPAVINDGRPQFFPSITHDGTVYFTRRLESGREVIVRSRRIGGDYAPVEVLPDEVNGGTGHYNAYVAPDESYIIVPTEGRADSKGRTDYFISYRDDEDVWTGPFNMGDSINTQYGDEWSPYVSPDGEYFFFMRGQSGAVAMLRSLVGTDRADLIAESDVDRLGLIWWIDASIIEELRP